MSSLIGGSPKPKAKPQEIIPPAPSIAHEEVQAAGDTERRKRRQASGRAATQLSGRGVSASANIGTSALLGG